MTKNATKPQTYPFTFRLTSEQRALLESKAEDMPLGEYIRRSILDNPKDSSDLPTDQVPVVASWVLGRLGQTGCCDDLHEISDAVQQGLVVLRPEETLVVIQACEDIAEIRRKLLKLTGLRKAANDN